MYFANANSPIWLVLVLKLTQINTVSLSTVFAIPKNRVIRGLLVLYTQQDHVPSSIIEQKEEKTPK